MQHVPSNIIIFPQPKAAYSFIGVFFRAGSRYETRRGLAHACEHVLLPDSDHYYEFEGEVGKEVFSATSTQFAEDTSTALKELVVRVTSPVDPVLVSKELETLKIELQEHPVDEGYQKLLKSLFGTHPYAFSAGGDPATIDEVRTDEIIAYKQTHLDISKSVWIVSGEFDMEAVQTVIRANGLEHTWALPEQRALLLSPRVVGIVEQYDDGDRVMVAIPLVPNGHFDERLKLMVGRTALVGHQFSVLNQFLRQKLRLVYSTQTDTQFYSEAGYLTISMFTESGRGDFVLQNLKNIFENLDTCLTDDHIRLAQKRLRFDLTLAQENPEAVGWWLGEDLLLSGRTISLSDATRTIAGFTPQEIRAVCNQFFSGPVEIIS